MRLGLPYDSGTGAGQSETLIAGMHGTRLTRPAVQVFVDASGQPCTILGDRENCRGPDGARGSYDRRHSDACRTDRTGYCGWRPL
jgi:hypothetical protein